MEAADLGRHTDKFDESTLAANTAIDARGGSPQGAHLSGAVTPRPPRGRRRQNQNGLDTTQVKIKKKIVTFISSPHFLYFFFFLKQLLRFLIPTTFNYFQVFNLAKTICIEQPFKSLNKLVN